MIKKSLLFIFATVLIFACGGNEGDDDSGGGSSSDGDGFDRGAMLTHLADDIIIPAFADFQEKTGDLVEKTTSFTSAPDDTNLEALKTSWLDAYKTWQYVEMFNIGKAEELEYPFYVNIYPASVTEIENNISNGGYDLELPVNYDAQGFPAIDYLLYGVGADSDAVLAKYTTDDNAEAYKTYLRDVVARIDSLTTTILDDWNDTYRDQFVSSTGNTATSAFNMLANDFVYYFEKGFRTNKVGIPSGQWSINTLPQNVEAYYNQEVSKTLALESLTAIEDFFNGKNYNSTAESLGFKAYLEFLDRDDLATSITSQFALIDTALNELNDNFVTQIADDNTKMEEAFDIIQVNVVNFKVDMLQAFDVSVDYADADGD